MGRRMTSLPAHVPRSPIMSPRQAAAVGAPSALVAAASLLLLACVARGCSDIMLSNPDIFEGAVVSARNVRTLWGSRG